MNVRRGAIKQHTRASARIVTGDHAPDWLDIVTHSLVSEITTFRPIYFMRAAILCKIGSDHPRDLTLRVSSDLFRLLNFLRSEEIRCASHFKKQLRLRKPR